MPILGQHIKERVESPFHKGEWFNLRTSLSPYVARRCLQEGNARTMEAQSILMKKVGAETYGTIMKLRREGLEASEIAKRIGATPDENQGAAGTDTGSRSDNPPAPSPGQTPPPDRGEPEGEEDTSPEPSEEEVEEATQQLMRNAYDLDYAAYRMIAGWSFPVPVKLEHVRNLDIDTRRWLQGLAWELIKHVKPEDLSGNL